MVLNFRRIPVEVTRLTKLWPRIKLAATYQNYRNSRRSKKRLHTQSIIYPWYHLRLCLGVVIFLLQPSIDPYKEDPRSSQSNMENRTDATKVVFRKPTIDSRQSTVSNTSTQLRTMLAWHSNTFPNVQQQQQ